MQFYQVKTVEETYQIIQDQVKPTFLSEEISLEQAFHRVLAGDVVARENIPQFARSTVDGYAVRASDTFGSSESMPSFLQVVGEVRMGETATRTLAPGEAIHVPTGGMLPPGSDSVIMIEYAEDIDGLLTTYRQVAPNENVIQIGEDLSEGSVILSKGKMLRAQELGALGALGITQVPVYQKVKVGYLSSGDEIVPYETQELNMGQIRDINVLTLSALVQEWGGEFVYGGIVRDEIEEFRQKAEELYQEVDFLVISGGSSVGIKDYTTEVIQSLGSPGVYVHGVSIKPGKPTIFAMANEKPVLGLPGHPASAMIIFSLFGQAIFSGCSGIVERRIPTRIMARIGKNIASSAGRSDYVRVQLQEKEDGWWAYPILGKSGLISTLVHSDGMLEITSEKEGIVEGDLVPVILFR